MTYYALLPLIVGFGFLYWSSILDDSDEILKFFFRMMFLPMIFLTIQFAILDVTLLYGADANTVALLAQFAYYFGWFLFAIGGYYLFKVLGLLYNIVMQKRKDRESELHGD